MAPRSDGTILYASSYKNQTLAIDGPSGPIWRASVAPEPHRPGHRQAAGHDAGGSGAIDRSGGLVSWQQPALARRNLTGAVVHGNYAVVGDYDGYLHWLRLDSGDFAARARAGRAPIRGTPVVSGDILVVQNTKGDISAWRVAH